MEISQFKIQTSLLELGVSLFHKKIEISAFKIESSVFQLQITVFKNRDISI